MGLSAILRRGLIRAISTKVSGLPTAVTLVFRTRFSEVGKPGRPSSTSTRRYPAGGNRSGRIQFDLLLAAFLSQFGCSDPLFFATL
jgi:hypothetical protein